MKKIRNFILVFLFLFPISNAFASITFVHKFSVAKDDSTSIDDSGDHIAGIHFNDNGTKMFVSYRQDFDDNFPHVSQYSLSEPYNISTRTYDGDTERCNLTDVPERVTDLEFSHDGYKMFVSFGSHSVTTAEGDIVYGYELTSPYDISTCSYSNNKTTNLDGKLNGSLAGDDIAPAKQVRLQGLEFNNNGTKMFLLFLGDGDDANGDTRKERLLEFNLSTPYDLTDITLVENAGINLTGSSFLNPMGMRFSKNGKRLFIVDHNKMAIGQISLNVAFSTASYTIDGTIVIRNIPTANVHNQPRGIALGPNGIKIYVGTDRVNSGNDGADSVSEFNTTCPFNVIAGKCTSITEGDRTGMALAQIEIANRTIAHSTDTALNRLKWIRRNKDLQDLSYQNIKLNFSNQMLASLSEAIQISTKEKEKDDDIFYWAEGSLAFGKVKETDTSSKKKIYTDGITIGADKFTVGDGIKGLAFRFSQNDVKVGTAGSKLDANTYNLTYYSTAPVKDDRRFLDTIIGVGALRYDISSVLDGSKLNGNRNGRQIYGTLKIKEEIKKDDHTLIPAAQIDLGYTLLSSYSESGISSMRFDKQSIQSRNLRLSLASVEELNNKKYKMKRHGKIEYQANLHRSSNIKYSYIGDSASGKFDTKLNSGALHNINGELGIDVIFDDNLSLFFIFEHNYAHRVGYTNKIHIAVGYLPKKDTNFALKIEGDDILKSKYIYTKNVNGLDIDFYLLNNNAMRPKTFDEIALNLSKVF